MDYELNEPQRLLKRAAADFFAREYPLDRMRDFRHDPDTNERELWTAISAMGWNAAPFSEEIGGYPGSFMDAAVLLEEMGRGACASPFVHSAVAAGLALAEVNHPLVKAIAAGDAVTVMAPRTLLSSVQHSADGHLDGTCLAVPWVNLATHYLVPLGSQRYALVDAKAVTPDRLDSAGLDCIGRFELRDARVMDLLDPGDTGTVCGGAAVALVLLDAGSRSLDLAVAYAKDRIQFGKPIGSFQALQHKCADMLIALEAGRNLAYKAATLHGQEGFARLARYAKAYLGEAVPRVTRDAIQVHGGVGFIDDHKVQLCYRLALGLANSYGRPGDIRRDVAEIQIAAAGR
ncbi:acyl-CoA/acyl-ACP dehydrogenase [bacterium]|nr:acyl-CoA/acyl-ACP dehydrogenase [bacterium]